MPTPRAYETFERRVVLPDGGECFFGGDLGAERARAMASVIQQLGNFNLKQSTMKLSACGDRLTMSYVVEGEAWNELDVIRHACGCAAGISELANENGPVDVRLLDTEGRIRKTVEWDESFRALLDDQQGG